jgi:hypothetical protein
MGAISGMVVKDLGMSVHDFRSLMNSHRFLVLTPAVVLEITMKFVVHSFCDMALLRRSEMDHATPPLYRPSAERSTVVGSGGTLARMTRRIGSLSKTSAKYQRCPLNPLR